MRVVAGALGGRRLRAPPGRSTRPTSDRVREAVFAMLGSIEDLAVLDLFAGSGALGIEALSRGASAAVFVDSDHGAAHTVRANLEALGLSAGVHQSDALSFLSDTGLGPFGLVFVDPPYDLAPRLGRPLSEALAPVLAPGALIVSESDKRSPLALTLPVRRERTYGDTLIVIHGGD